jgi:hypothetical protein
MSEPMTELPRRGHPGWIWLLALAPFAVLMIRQWPYGCGLVCGDYAQYYLHATALLHGRPYTDIGYIYTTQNPWIGPPAQPPGFPLTLVPIFAVFGPSTTAVKLLLHLCAVVFLLLAGFRVARSGGRSAGAASVLLTGVALASMYATDSALSDLGFCALFWAFIVVADRPGEWSRGRIAGLTLLGLVAMSYRTAGAALIPATILFAIVGGKGRRAITPAVIWICIAGLVAIRLPVATAVLSNLRLEPGALSRMVLRNLDTLRSGLFEALLSPFPWRTPNAAYHLLSVLLMLWGLVRTLWHDRRTMLTALFLVYVAMLLVIPIREQRYLWPILPVFGWAFYDGVVALLTWRPRWPAERAHRLALATCAAVALLASVIIYGRPPRDSLFNHPEVRQLFARIAALPRSPSPRVMFTNPRVLTWETGVPAMGTFKGSTPVVMAELRRKRISHVVLGDLGTTFSYDSTIRHAVAESSSVFSPVYSNSEFTLLALLPSAVPAQPTSGVSSAPAADAALPRTPVAADSSSARATKARTR